MPINGFPGQVISATAPTVSTAGATGIWGLDEQLQYAGQNLWPGYQISRSVRLRSSASAYFNRTPASASNQKTWTWSGWVKRGNISAMQTIFGAFDSSTSNFVDFGLYTPGSSVPAFWCRRYNNGAGTNTWVMESTSLYRDLSAWYHVVFHLNCTSSPTFRAWINGVELTAWTQNTPPTNSNWEVNGTNAHYIGRNPSAANQYYDGYLTEINFIDGQALDPSYFGVTSAATGVWGPIKYTGTYGTNGFYLNFSDNSAATATTIGKDYSGNGNNWTPNNISVTAGTTYDSMVDVPVGYGGDTGVGGEVRGNYAVMNPLAMTGTYTNGNLDFTTAAADSTLISTIAVSSGKWYCEFSPTSITANCLIGIVAATARNGFAPTNTNQQPSIVYASNTGNKFVNGTGTSYGATYTTNDVIGVALDLDNLTIQFYKNGAGQGSITGVTASTYCFAVGDGDSVTTWSGWANFGQRAFASTAPSGYKALCTQNLSTPTIANGAGYMNATLYNGNSSTQTISNSAGFYPDFNWLKIRSSTGSHVLVNSVVGGSKQLFSNLTNAEQTDTNMTSAISASGIALGNNTTGTGNSNITGYTYVAWQWLAGAGSSSSNTDGNRTSTVSVNATAGFSVVTWTFSTSANNTIGHGLGVAPSFIMVKDRSAAVNWDVYHVSLGYTQRLILNSTGGAVAGYWAAAPTSTVFSMTTAAYTNNDNIVAYCFAPIAGYSAFGTYTGNGSTDGTFVYLGFRPRWIMYKPTFAGATDWVLWDTVRSTYNVQGNYLLADTSGAEGSATVIDLLSNGFKLRTTTTGNNGSGDTIVYAAFAENPFKYALAR